MTMRDKSRLSEIVDQLPPDMQREVLDFAAFLAARIGERDRSGRHAPGSRGPVKQWKAALRQAAGMWRDRPEIARLMEQVRREADRVEPPDTPL